VCPDIGVAGITAAGTTGGTVDITTTIGMAVIGERAGGARTIGATAKTPRGRKHPTRALPLCPT